MFSNQVLLALAASLLVSFTSGLPQEDLSILSGRDTPTGRCGAQYSGYSCTQVAGANQCCSQYSWCGDTAGHCGTGCQPNYGKCNSASSSSVGPSSSSVKTTTTTSKSSTSTSTSAPTSTNRPKLGSVPYGVSLYDCTKPGTIALTYDDGPWIYTSQLLDILLRKGVKVTFFVTGNNLDKGAIDGPDPKWANIIKRAYDEGHQIAGHTWDHLSLSSISETSRRFQMTRLEQALVKIIGKYPTYMRPPYIQCNTACEKTMGDLGYHVIIWDLDTDDYNNDSPTLIENSKRNVRNALAGNLPIDSSFMSIAHDIHEQTVVSLTEYQIDYDIAAGYKHVRLGECFGDPEANWYRT